MGIEVHMDMREIRAMLEREAQKHIQRTIALLQYVGETVVNQIRTGQISNWIDRTGNLRSSIGYVITLDGQPIETGGFKIVAGPERIEKGAGLVLNGASEGEEYARQLAMIYSKGIALIVVAGMEYASYVEKRDNKTVLAQGEIEAEKLVTDMIRQLNSKR
jgi:hypothetical protein